MNIWHVLASIPQVIADIQDLAKRMAAFSSDPAIKAAIAANPTLKAQSDAISLDCRQIQEAFR